jgi:hypothetical protein
MMLLSVVMVVAMMVRFLKCTKKLETLCEERVMCLKELEVISLA